jgi:hypothetical protein
MKNIFIITLLIVISFSNSYSNPPLKDMKNSFGLIQMNLKLFPLPDSNVDPIKINTINNIIDSPLLRASSFIVKHKKETTIILTSEHVCSEIMNANNKKSISGFIELLSKYTDFTELFILDKSKQSKIVIKPIVFVKDFNGNKYNIISINNLDKIADICLVETESVWGQVSKISQKDCSYGEKVYNISSSGGIYSPKSIPFRSGYFSGIHIDKSFTKQNISNENNLYTIPALPGSSGSGVYNSKGEICGNINISYKRSDVSFGATRKSIISLLNSKN